MAITAPRFPRCLLLLLLPVLLHAAPRQKVGQKFLPEGQFVWHEIVTNDPVAAKKFYTAALDWKPVSAPVTSPGEQPYVMFIGNGQMFAGIGAAPVPGETARWTCWVQVPDADLAADAALESGGLVVRPAREHLIGRVAEVADPGQARLNVVQLHIRQPFVVVPPVVWHHGETFAAKGTNAFYRNVAGWTLEPSPAASECSVVLVEGLAAADLVDVPADSGATIGWLPCFAVRDLKLSVARVVAGGGRQILPPDERAELGNCARVADPQGAEFWLVER